MLRVTADIFSGRPNPVWTVTNEKQVQAVLKEITRNLVAGTNRLKAFDEISSPAVALKSLDELRSQLARLVRGEEIVWTTWTDDRLTLPPQSVIDEVKKACQELGLELTIASK